MAESAATISIPDGFLYLRIPQSEVPDIPPNWHESWHSLHSALRWLEEGGLDPHSAILGLVHAELVREDAAALDKSSLIHLNPHLGTNYVPAVSERKVIKQYCEQGGQQIARISATIQRDTSQLASSSGRLAALHELVDPYFALLSPIRGIPPEILQEIFVSCLPTRHCAITHAAHVPLVLGSVCRIWREISLSTPALWSSIYVVVPHTIDNHPPVAYMEGLRLWLVRSGGCPLTISVFVPNGCEVDINLIVDLIMPYSHRWKSLKLQLTRDEGLTKLWNLMPEDIPLLETLEISDAVPEQHALRFLSVPPNLRHLALKYFLASVSLPARSWERITSLCLDSQRSFFNLDASQTMELVTQCANLTNCRLAFPIGPSDGPPPAGSFTSALRQITLPHLDTLSLTGEVTGDATFNIVAMLDALVLPALQELHLIGLSFLQFDPNVPHPPAVSDCDILQATDELINRSTCDVRELSIQFADGDATALLQCLQRCPSLTRLELHYTRIFQQDPVNLMPILTALSATASSSVPLCPDLLHLRIAYCDYNAEVHPILRTLIESRCSLVPFGFARLRTVNLSLLTRMALNSAEFAAAMHPSKVTIMEPIHHVSQMDRSSWGIPSEDRGM